MAASPTPNQRASARAADTQRLTRAFAKSHASLATKGSLIAPSVRDPTERLLLVSWSQTARAQTRRQLELFYKRVFKTADAACAGKLIQ